MTHLSSVVPSAFGVTVNVTSPVVVAEVATPVAVVPGASGVPPFTVPWECRSAGCS
ncbi:hypothetical protein SLEX105133_08440 [Slackia exigua]